MSEIDQILPLNEYAQKLGYSVQELGAVLGYTEKAFTDLPIEMQKALRKEKPRQNGFLGKAVEWFLLRNKCSLILIKEK